MPNVNGKKFPYTPAGMKAAKNYAMKTTAKKKPGAPGPIKDAPKQNPNSGLYGPIVKKPIKPKAPVDRAFNKDRGGLNGSTPTRRNGIIKLDPRESNGGFNKKPKSPKKNPIMTTLPSKSSKTKKM